MPASRVIHIRMTVDNNSTMVNWITFVVNRLMRGTSTITGLDILDGRRSKRYSWTKGQPIWPELPSTPEKSL